MDIRTGTDEYATHLHQSADVTQTMVIPVLLTTLWLRTSAGRAYNNSPALLYIPQPLQLLELFRVHLLDLPCLCRPLPGAKRRRPAWGARLPPVTRLRSSLGSLLKSKSWRLPLLEVMNFIGHAKIALAVQPLGHSGDCITGHGNVSL